jgi:hypothetical protein
LWRFRLLARIIFAVAARCALVRRSSGPPVDRRFERVFLRFIEPSDAFLVRPFPFPGDLVVTPLLSEARFLRRVKALGLTPLRRRLFARSILAVARFWAADRRFRGGLAVAACSTPLSRFLDNLSR